MREATSVCVCLDDGLSVPEMDKDPSGLDESMRSIDAEAITEDVDISVDVVETNDVTVEVISGDDEGEDDNVVDTLPPPLTVTVITCEPLDDKDAKLLLWGDRETELTADAESA